MKVIFLTSIPFIRQHCIDMYIDAIVKTFDVALWDLSGVYGRQEVVKERDVDSLRIKSVKEFEKLLSEEKQKTRIVVITNILLPQLRRVYPVIHGLGIPIININKESFASWMSFAGSVHLFGKIRLLSWLKALTTYVPVSRKILNFYRNGNIKYDYCLSSYNFYPEQSRHFVRIHHVKYDESRAAEKQAPVVNGRYILFIDASLADHPMYAKSRNKIDRPSYLGQLNRYFKMLEDHYKMPVVISAHPKSSYSEGDFEGRSIILYKTPNLIQHATYIVSHYSTSLFDAILQKKPFKVMYSDALLRSATRGATAMGIQMANMLNVEKVNLDDPKVSAFTMDADVYDRFSDRFIVNNEKLGYSNGELIVQFLKQFEV